MHTQNVLLVCIYEPDELEDKVWDVNEVAVAGVMKVAIGKCCEALDSLKERLPRSDQQRRELARGYVHGYACIAPVYLVCVCSCVCVCVLCTKCMYYHACEFLFFFLCICVFVCVICVCFYVCGCTLLFDFDFLVDGQHHDAC